MSRETPTVITPRPAAGGASGPPTGDDSPWADLLLRAQQYAETPLSEKSLPDPPKNNLLEGNTEKALPFDVDNVTFSIFGKAAISVFNAASDKDPDAILGKATAENDDALAIGSLIDLQAGKAWLKYDLEAGVKTDVDLKDAGFDFEAEAGVRHAAYCVHEPQTTVGQAIIDDLADPRFIFKTEHLHRLQPGEAVALFAHGKLQAQLEYKWSDILTNGISVLGRLLPVAGEAFNIQVGAGATAKLNVAVTDVFQVVVVRVDANTFRVALRKADGKALAAGFTASVHAQFADEEEVEKVLKQTVDGLIGAPLDEVRKVLENVTNLGDLEAGDKALVAQVLKRLGLDGIVDDAAELKKRIDDFEKEVDKTLKEIATTKAELSFSYDYKRVSSEDAVLVARMDASAIDAYHHDLVRGRFQALLAHADDAGKPAITLERFLYQKSLEVERSWGFSLNFGKWLKASGRDKVELKDVERKNADGDVQRTFLGSRSYRGDWHKDAFTWDVDFNAEMPVFSPTPDTANEFDYSFHLLMEDEQGKVKDKEIPALVDRAVIWGAVPHTQADETRLRIGGLIDGSKDVTFSYQLKLDEVAFKAILDDLATRNAAGFGRALGEAMPWGKDLRQDPRSRSNLYGDHWRSYLESASMSPRDLAAKTAAAFESRGQELHRSDYKTLAFHERNWMKSRTTTIGGLAELNGTRDEWNAFLAGAGILVTAIADRKPHEEIRKAFKKIRRLWTQSLHIWAFGVYLRDLVDRRPELGEHVERIFTVTYKNKNSEKVVEHFGVSRPLPEEPDED